MGRGEDRRRVGVDLDQTEIVRGHQHTRRVRVDLHQSEVVTHEDARQVGVDELRKERSSTAAHPQIRQEVNEHQTSTYVNSPPTAIAADRLMSRASPTAVWKIPTGQ